jgi:hypothetical protein
MKSKWNTIFWFVRSSVKGCLLFPDESFHTEKQFLFTIFSRFNQFPGPTVSNGRYIELETCKTLACTNRSPDPFRDFPFGFSVQISALLLHASKPNGFLPLNDKQPRYRLFFWLQLII